MFYHKEIASFTALNNNKIREGDGYEEVCF